MFVAEISGRKNFPAFVGFQDHRQRDVKMSDNVPVVRIRNVLDDHLARIEFFFAMTSRIIVVFSRGSAVNRIRIIGKAGEREKKCAGKKSKAGNYSVKRHWLSEIYAPKRRAPLISRANLGISLRGRKENRRKRFEKDFWE
jgi:hypothetical protein